MQQAVIEHPCPACGTRVACGMTNGSATCWCFALPHGLPVTADTTCYCRACLQTRIAEQAQATGREQR